MTRSSTSPFALAFSCALLLLSGALRAQETVVEAVAADPIANLIPADAAVVIRIAPLGELEGKIKKLVASIDKDFAEMIDASALLQEMGFEAELDRSKPMALSLRLAEDDPTSPPTITMILAIKDPAALSEMLTGNIASEPVVRGSYIAFSPDGPYAPGEGKSRLVKRMGNRDISVVADLNLLATTFKPFMEMGLASFEQEALPGLEMAMGPDGAKMVMGWVETAEAFVEALDTFDLHFLTDGNDVELQVGMDTKSGSRFSKMTWSDQANLGKVARGLPAGHPVAILMSMDFEAMTAQFMDLMKQLGESMGEEDLAMTLRMMEKSKEAIKLYGRDVAMTMGFGKGGIEFAQAMSTKGDAEKMAAEWRSLYADPLWKDMGVDVDFGETKALEGASISPMKMRMDMKKLIGDQELPEEVQGMISEMMAKVFGGKSGEIHGHLLTKADTLSFGLGSEAGLKECADQFVQGASANRHVAYGLKKAGKNAAMMMTMDLREVLRQARVAAEAFEAADGFPRIGAGNSVPIAVYAGASGTRISMGMATLMDDLAPIVRQLMRGSRR